MLFKPFFLILIVVSFLAVRAIAQDTALIVDVPLPADIEIDGTHQSPFVGIWVGRWDSWRHHILVVEGEAENGIFDVVYAVGPDQYSGGNWFRSKARIEHETLILTDARFAARYSLSDTGRLRGIYPTGDRFAILERQEVSAVLAAPQEAWFDLGQREFLTTDLTEDGKTIRLSVAIYVPNGAGPFPLALVHHGSTGSGTNPRAFKWFFTNDWFADMLNAQGWIAAFPQRRGRGGSDGLYDEGFSEDRSKGYSLEARLSLPGADRALTDANAALAALQKRPDVSASPVLFAGMSRGGVVALMQAGDQPEKTAGVINFVGGWITESRGDLEINPTLFRRAAGFKGRVLSVYGEEDPFYSIDHSRSNLAYMEEGGPESELHIVSVPGTHQGHWAMWWPSLWEEVVNEYLEHIKNHP